jgi:hypothetical protein
MADYCKQCSKAIFGKDYKELANLVTEDEFALGIAASVLCEGCGHTFVDHEGNCLSKEHNHKKEGQ